MRGDGGVTLLELLVVIAILALAVAAMPLDLRGKSIVDETADTAQAIESALRRTRAEAIARGQPRALVVDLAARRWGVGEPSQALPEGVPLAMRSGRAAGERRDGRQAIRFFPDGSATGGEIAVGQGEARRVITVRWLTGAVRRDG